MLATKDDIFKLRREILSRVNILDYASSKLNLKKVGSNYFAFSPFKPEKTPSFSVSPSKGIFKCFASGYGGNVIKLRSLLEGISEEEAIRLFATELGLISENEFLEQSKKDYIRYLEIYKTFFNMAKENLLKNKYAQKYISERGIDLSVALFFDTGYAPGGRHITDALLRKGFSIEELIYSGVSAYNNGDIIDYFQASIIWPIRQGQDIIAAQGRVMYSNNQKKYNITKSNQFFISINDPFNINRVKQNINKEDYIVITEGVIDAISMYKLGFYNVIAAYGVNNVDRFMQKIQALTKNIILALDNDDSGLKTTLNICKRYICVSNLFVTDYKDCKDANEYLVKLGREGAPKIFLAPDYLLSHADKLSPIYQVNPEALIGELLSKCPAKVKAFYISKRGYLFDIKNYSKNIIKKEELENDKVFLLLCMLYKAYECNYDIKIKKKIKNMFLLNDTIIEEINSCKKAILYKNIDSYEEIKDTLYENMRDYYADLIFYAEAIDGNKLEEMFNKLVDIMCREKVETAMRLASK